MSGADDDADRRRCDRVVALEYSFCLIKGGGNNSGDDDDDDDDDTLVVMTLLMRR